MHDTISECGGFDLTYEPGSCTLVVWKGNKRVATFPAEDFVPAVAKEING